MQWNQAWGNFWMVRSCKGLCAKPQKQHSSSNQYWWADVQLCLLKVYNTPLGMERVEQESQGQTGDKAALLKAGEMVAWHWSKINVLPRFGSPAHHFDNYKTRLYKELKKTWPGSVLHWVPRERLEMGFNSFSPQVLISIKWKPLFLPKPECNVSLKSLAKHFSLCTRRSMDLIPQQSLEHTQGLWCLGLLDVPAMSPVPAFTQTLLMSVQCTEQLPCHPGKVSPCLHQPTV